MDDMSPLVIALIAVSKLVAVGAFVIALMTSAMARRTKNDMGELRSLICAVMALIVMVA